MGLFDFFGGEDPAEERPLLYQREDDLAAILRDPSVDIKTKDLASRLESDMRKLASAGIDPGLAEPRRSLFWDVIDTIDAPRQGIVGIADTLLRGDMFKTDEKTGEDVGLGFRRGQKENVTWSDVFRRNDVIDNPVLRGVTGFALDVLSDPLTYVGVGAGTTSARVGNQAVTKVGKQLADESIFNMATRLSKDLVDTGADVDVGFLSALTANRKVADAFSAAHEWQGLNKIIQKNPEDTLAIARRAQKEQIISEVFDLSHLQKELFEPKNRVNLGISLPFLGHLDEGTKSFAEQTVAGKDPGLVSQAFRALGKAISPKRIDLGSVDIPEPLIEGFKNINAAAANGIGRIAAKAEALPVLGIPVQKTNEILKSAKNLFMDTFARTALYGKGFTNEYEKLVDARAVNRSNAARRTFEGLGDDLIQDAETMRDGALVIDAAAGMQAQRLAEIAAAKGTPADLRDKIKLMEEGLGDAKRRGEILPGELLHVRSAIEAAKQAGIDLEGEFRAEIGRLLTGPLPAKTKVAVDRIQKLMDQAHMEETGLGVAGGFLEHYFPHRYINTKATPNSKAGSYNPFKARKYDTIGEAFSKGAHVADTNVPKLIMNRIERSLNAQSEALFSQRMAIEYGMPEHLVFDTYIKAAENGPNSPEAAMLRRNFIEAPDIDAEAMIKGATDTARIQQIQKAGLRPENMVIPELGPFSEQVRQEMFKSGKYPLNNDQANALFREIGEKVSIPGQGEVWLPTKIAGAMKQAIAGRDLLKDAAAASPLAKAGVEALDSAVNFFKKAVTLPFPAYWAQNFFGDRFRQLSQGIHAYDPKIFATTHDLLKGKTAIRGPGGIIYDTQTFKKILNTMGLDDFSAAEMVGVLKSAGDTDVTKYLKGKQTLAENLTSGGAAGKIAALTKAQQALQNGTDRFFRVAHVVHRLQQGDAIPDAVKAANDLYFNYRNLSPVEQSFFRRFYMFYGYMSKATKATVTDFFTSPGTLTNQLSAVRGMAEMFSDPNAAPTADILDLKLLTSAVNAEQISHVAGQNEKGRPIIGRGFGAPLNAVLQQFTAYTPRNLSIGELMETAGASLGRTAQKQFASANPAIKMAAEALTGKNLYFNKPLDAEFLRKLPSLNAAAERLTGIPHDELPLDLDAPVKAFLKAVPDGKGRLIANSGMYWVLMNLVPGLSRATSMAGAFSNADIPTKAALLRTMTNVNLTDTDVSRTALYDKKEQVDKVMRSYSVNQRIKNKLEGDE